MNGVETKVDGFNLNSSMDSMGISWNTTTLNAIISTCFCWFCEFHKMAKTSCRINLS